MNYSERLNYVIPGGAHTYSRGDDQYPENAPQILEKGHGAYVYTPEGEKFLDYGMALRAVTLGYAEPTVAKAAFKQIEYGNNLTRPSLVELEAAELLCDLIPSVEMVKFAKNGSTVTTAALKVARGYTGRKYIARCIDHPFFSFDDWFIGDTPLKNGIPEEHYKLTLNFIYNDIASLEKIFAEFPGQIAGVILEPATLSHPLDGFLQKVKQLCHNNGAIFILDEMITGFRWDLQGAQKYYDIEPDLCTFGKGMANGFSVAALCGKREIMNIGGIKNLEKERLFLISTTHGAEMCGLGAFIETIKFYKEHKVIDHIWSYGEKLINGMNEIAKELEISDFFSVYGIPCSPNYVTKDKTGTISMAFRTLFAQEMIKNGVLMPWIAISYAHKEEELKKTLVATKKTLVIYKKALEEGYEKYLQGAIIKPVFRKFN
ncbi:MAG: glutamate-1-semialdehyde 2,1-aminomutase [Bacteroidetes bacterium 41-46]|nr:MAG: glutamate-1-semialdehyde 2,1-aminomutase [Bacteroidetes bacterium 41-46]